MSFKENLKRKMLIDSLTRTASQSVGAPGVHRKVDKETIRKLLSLSPFIFEKRRDLDLYFRELEPGLGEILVLDNELPLYGKTTLDDVALRRSPELKEMVNIRNVIKILKDSDILMCKGREALRYVQDRALELLDLRYEPKDIEEMADEGLEAIARVDSEAVMEALDLFVEILGYEPVPAEVLVNDYIMFGACQKDERGKELWGPIVMYNDRTNTIRGIKRPMASDDPVERDMIARVALGEIEADAEEFSVFPFLKEEVLKKKQPTVH
ncbi:MAG: hypothetical protein SWH78_08160 [Thermodesulfobacteriota bacterium]|nr:hypothetical protein [Thermodesulfobacteriota bacterium]